jgi:hypothetical protein
MWDFMVRLVPSFAFHIIIIVKGIESRDEAQEVKVDFPVKDAPI